MNKIMISKIVESILKKAWFPGREEVKYFEDLEKKQERIWHDSIDQGYIVDDKKQTEARTQIKELLDIYNAKITKGPGKDTTTEMFIPFEQDEGYYKGVILRIYYHEGGKNRTDSHKPGYDPSYLSIEEIRHRQKDFKYKDKKANINNIPF